MKKAKKVVKPELTLADLLNWHKNQEEVYSAFGPMSDVKDYHKECVSLLTKAIKEQAEMAKAIVFLGAYRTHDDKAFNANHSIAVGVARKIHNPNRGRA